MDRRNARGPRRGPRFWLTLLATTVLLAGCTGSSTTPSPLRTAASPSPSAVRTSLPTALATPGPAASADPTAVATGALPPQSSGTPVSTPTPRPTAGPDLAISTVARAPADPAAAKTAAASISAFGLDLLRQLLADPSLNLATKNAVFSPTSIALALAMARAGAQGETASQMDQVLHTSGWDALGPGLDSLEQALASRNATWKDYEGTEHELAMRIANAAYGQQGWSIEPSYLDAIAAAFGAGLRLVDFAGNPEAARQAINAWVSDQTAGRIPQLLGQGDVDTSTRLALVNAVYLKAEWAWMFLASQTASAPFFRLDGSQVDVPMMFQVGTWLSVPILYAKGHGWQAVELSYNGANDTTPLAMTLILPNHLTGFEARLTASELARITTALAKQREAFSNAAVDAMLCHPGQPPTEENWCYPYDLDLYMPRFSIETRADLVPTLSALGMPLAFDPTSADFSAIHAPSSDTARLYIATVVHQANIDVNEKGTTASASTAALGGTGGGPSPARTITVRLDHPFLFLVRDLDTGAVLFMGQVTDPSVGSGG